MRIVGFLLLICTIITAPFQNAFANSHAYECFNNFYDNFAQDYSNNSFNLHIQNYEIQKRRVGSQNVILVNLIDPVDDKQKIMFLTKTESKVCDSSAPEGEKCKEPEERHLNASLGRYISVLPDVYKKTIQDSSSSEIAVKRPAEVMNKLSDCKRVTATLKKRILMKARAITSIYDDAFNRDEKTKPQNTTASTQ